jgi:predicted small secreted protein
VLALVPFTTQNFWLNAVQGIVVVPLSVHFFFLKKRENSKKRTLSNVQMETGDFKLLVCIFGSWISTQK